MLFTVVLGVGVITWEAVGIELVLGYVWVLSVKIGDDPLQNVAFHTVCIFDGWN